MTTEKKAFAYDLRENNFPASILKKALAVFEPYTAYFDHEVPGFIVEEEMTLEEARQAIREAGISDSSARSEMESGLCGGRD